MPLPLRPTFHSLPHVATWVLAKTRLPEETRGPAKVSWRCFDSLDRHQPYSKCTPPWPRMVQG